MADHAQNHKVSNSAGPLWRSTTSTTIGERPMELEKAKERVGEISRILRANNVPYFIALDDEISYGNVPYFPPNMYACACLLIALAEGNIECIKLPEIEAGIHLQREYKDKKVTQLNKNVINSMIDVLQELDAVIGSVGGVNHCVFAFLADDERGGYNVNFSQMVERNTFFVRACSFVIKKFDLRNIRNLYIQAETQVSFIKEKISNSVKNKERTDIVH